MRTLSMPAACTSLAFSSVISSLTWTMTWPPNGSLMFSRLTGAHDAVAQGLDHLARLDDGTDVDAVHGAAVVVGDDHVLETSTRRRVR
jgi:hypothetical protein